MILHSHGLSGFKQMVRPYPSSSYPHPTFLSPKTSTFYHSRLGGPRKRLIFSANGHEGEYRLDIDTDGTVSIQTGVKSLGRALQPKSALQSESDQLITDTRNDSINKNNPCCKPQVRDVCIPCLVWVSIPRKPVLASLSHHDWISVSNVAFAPDSMGHISLPLVNGWAAYGGSYGTPDYTVRNGICSLEGLLWKTGGPKEQVATLPEDCRPGAWAARRSRAFHKLGECLAERF